MRGGGDVVSLAAVSRHYRPVRNVVVQEQWLLSRLASIDETIQKTRVKP
jgi:hypothetical protein